MAAALHEAAKPSGGLDEGCGDTERGGQSQPFPPSAAAAKMPRMPPSSEPKKPNGRASFDLPLRNWPQMPAPITAQTPINKRYFVCSAAARHAAITMPSAAAAAE